MKLPDELTRLLREVPALSRAYLVGGCVRDSLLGIAHKDFDLEVYGVDYETLARQLTPKELEQSVRSLLQRPMADAALREQLEKLV
jgi:tRNA nucleotidyltransferase/poly(A) polymerase